MLRVGQKVWLYSLQTVPEQAREVGRWIGPWTIMRTGSNEAEAFMTSMGMVVIQPRNPKIGRYPEIVSTFRLKPYPWDRYDEYDLIINP